MKEFETQLNENIPKLPKAKASASSSKILCGEGKVARQTSHSDVSQDEQFKTKGSHVVQMGAENQVLLAQPKQCWSEICSLLREKQATDTEVFFQGKNLQNEGN